MRRLHQRDRRFGNNRGDAAVVPAAPTERGTIPSPVAAVIDRWEDSLHHAAARRRVSPVTARKYASVARAWGGWLGDQAVSRPTSADLHAFLAWGRRQGWGVATRNMYGSALRGLYRWAHAHGHGADIASGLVREHRPPPQASPALAPVHVRALLRTIPGRDLRATRDRFIIALLYGCALESVSLVRARVRDLDAAAGTFRHQPRAHTSPDVVSRLPSDVLRLHASYARQLPRRSPNDPLIVATDPSTGRPVPGRSLSALSIRLLVRRTLLVAYGSHPAVRGQPEARRTTLPQQRPASRVLRRSALFNQARLYGVRSAAVLSRLGRPCQVRYAVRRSSPLRP